MMCKNRSTRGIKGIQKVLFCSNFLDKREILPPYGGYSSMVEHWTVAPSVAGSNPVTHPASAIKNFPYKF